ncbi:MAG: hypothetical protein OXH84_03200 [Gammaproteobacteria bacterium]|nr:hypothetical protein [Gammaproteobacteria bacterium]
MQTNRRLKLWIGVGSLFSLVALGVGVLVFLNSSRSISEDKSFTPEIQPVVATISPTPENVSAQPESLDIPKLPTLDYPPGSVGEACRVNDFPPYDWYRDQSMETRRKIGERHWDAWEAIESEKCRTALERHLNPINPYHWGTDNTFYSSSLAFVSIENPLTFERIFTDPIGDFLRVQEVLARPECQLAWDTENKRELNDTCHADAIHNYALITQHCYRDEHIQSYGSGGLSYQIYKEENNSTQEDRNKWIQILEKRWLDRKCESLDPIIDLWSSGNTELREQIHALRVDGNEQYAGYRRGGPRVYSSMTRWHKPLIDLAAHLGDEAAGLSPHGHEYGRFADWYNYVFQPMELYRKYPPTIDRVRHIIQLFSKDLCCGNRRDLLSIQSTGEELLRSIVWPSLDHDMLVQHLCAPPYLIYSLDENDAIPEPPSCREIVNKLKQEALTPFMLEAIATFEDVAMRHDVYQ